MLAYYGAQGLALLWRVVGWYSLVRGWERLALHGFRPVYPGGVSYMLTLPQD